MTFISFFSITYLYFKIKINRIAKNVFRRFSYNIRMKFTISFFSIALLVIFLVILPSFKAYGYFYVYFLDGYQLFNFQLFERYYLTGIAPSYGSTFISFAELSHNGILFYKIINLFSILFITMNILIIVVLSSSIVFLNIKIKK